MAPPQPSIKEVDEPLHREILSATLPVNISDGISLDPIAAREFGARFAAQYCAAEPYPHIVIDNFLPDDLAEAILANFPTETGAGDVLYKDRLFEHRKRQIFPDDCNEYVRRIFSFFNSAAMLGFLEGLTTIEGLISDPYFEGGGFHEISRGGKLGIHADFRVNRKLRLNRRLNLLVYLNKNWEDAHGGHLEMWDKAVKRKVRSITPLFNRCVIFNTDKDSYHGHPDPLKVPEHLTRKSMALYYYTASDQIYQEIPAHGTVFFARPDDASHAKRSAIAWRLRMYFGVAEWLPPILYRNLRALKARLRSVPPRR
jgi:2OG-Fe(II) oxygenase superfamily